jgi:hypothetical protein
MEGAGKLSAEGSREAWPRRLHALGAEFGATVACLYIVHRLVTRLSGGRARLVPYAFYAQPIGSGLLAAVRDDPNTSVEAASISDPVCVTFPRPASVVRQRYDRGARCYVARVKGSFGGYIWISRDRHLEDEVRCEYLLSEPSCSAWDFDVYVEPRLRLGRTLARLWKHVDEALTSEGLRWSFSRISMFNSRSLRAHERLGAVRIGSAVFVVLGPMQLSILSARPYVHASWRPSPGPTIHLAPPARRDPAR